MRERRFRMDEIVIEITPLVDVVFLLLLFFILTTTFTVEEKSMSVNLPKAITGAESARSDVVVIFVDSNDNVMMDGKRINPEDLKGMLDELRKNRKFSRAIIKADESAHHGKDRRKKSIFKKKVFRGFQSHILLPDDHLDGDGIFP